MKNLRFLLMALGFLATGNSLYSQPGKYTADTDSVHHICDVLLQIISVDKGEPVDWDRFLNLFLPDAVLIRAQKTGDSTSYQSMPVKMMKKSKAYSQNGFNEKALKRIVHVFGAVACVYESFESSSPDGKYKSRGINIYQLINSGGRWWIASISWCDETDKLKLPEEMLKG